jgi:hypothetical protein
LLVYRTGSPVSAAVGVACFAVVVFTTTGAAGRVGIGAEVGGFFNLRGFMYTAMGLP